MNRGLPPFSSDPTQRLPPRVRELLRLLNRHNKVIRITPACAGITFNTDDKPLGEQDHPRVCGNYSSPPYRVASNRGSPPRVRELHKSGAYDENQWRITPACAGITRSTLSDLNVHKDHPRVCGNYSKLATNSSSMRGSPPRVRELQMMMAMLWAQKRITPACAGITFYRSFTFLRSEDHPRVCGNYLCARGRGRGEAGSPPRVRELPVTLNITNAPHGITPACAGITSP